MWSEHIFSSRWTYNNTIHDLHIFTWLDNTLLNWFETKISEVWAEKAQTLDQAVCCYLLYMPLSAFEFTFNVIKINWRTALKMNDRSDLTVLLYSTLSEDHSGAINTICLCHSGIWLHYWLTHAHIYTSLLIHAHTVNSNTLNYWICFHKDAAKKLCVLVGGNPISPHFPQSTNLTRSLITTILHNLQE